MGNIRLYYDNLFDALEDGAMTATTSASGLPVTHLKDPFRTRVWRATGVTSQAVTWDLGVEDTLWYVGLVNHNLSAAAQVVVTADDAPDFASPVYSDVFDAWDPVVGFGEGGFGELGFGGYMTEADIDALSAGGVRIFDFGMAVSARYWRIAFYDPDNADGYVEAGRLYCGRYWEPEENFDFQWSLTPTDASAVVYSEGGQAWCDLAEKRWRVEFQLRLIHNEERYWPASEMLRRQGVRRDLIVSMWPDVASGARYFTTLYGRFERVPPLSQDTAIYSSAPFIFMESL